MDQDQEQEDSVDSEATITDDEEVLLSSDDEEMEEIDWTDREGHDASSETNLTPFENEFARFFIQHKLTEKHGDGVIALVCTYSGLNSRKTKSIMENLKGKSIRSFNYALCDVCNKSVRKEGNNYKCTTCNNTLDTYQLNNYVSFNLEDQLKVVSKVCQLEEASDLTLRLIITCDGIPLSKSSEVELYPLIVYIDNFQNLNLRSKCYIIGSIAMIRKKVSKIPLNPTLLLRTFLRDFEAINAKGGIETAWSPHTKLEVISFLADTPCRAKFLNVLQHNGTYPCHRCYVKLQDKLVPVHKSNEIRLKTMEEVNQLIDELENLRVVTPRTLHTFGIKGKSLLARFNFDYIKQSPLEIMHCLFLGVAKNFLEMYLFESKNSLKEPQRNQVDQRIKLLKPPSNSKRSIRQLNEFKHFKSAEFELIFFYYGYFMFKGILSDEKFNFLMFLAATTFKLWSRNATTAQIDQVPDEIDHFMDVFRRKNDERDLIRFNLHWMLHLYEDRKTFGPLSKMNAYSYEDRLQHFKYAFLSRNRRLESLVKKIKAERMIPVEAKDLEEVSFIVSCGNVSNELKTCIQSYMRLNDLEMRQIRYFEGFSKGFLKVTRFEYLKRKNNCDSFVECKNMKFYNVRVIFLYKSNEFCLLEKVLLANSSPTITLENVSVSLNHTFPIIQLETRQFEVQPIEYIIKQLSFINLPNSLSSTFDSLQYLIDVEN